MAKGVAPSFTAGDVDDLASGKLIVHCTTRDKYVTVLQATARDDNLSFKARGILVYLLSLPANWKTNLLHLAKQSKKDGRDAIASGIRELIAEGYARRVVLRDEGGQITSRELQIAEVPLFRANPVQAVPSLCSENPDEGKSAHHPENPDEAAPAPADHRSGLPDKANPTLRSTEVRKDLVKKPPLTPPTDTQQLQLVEAREGSDEPPKPRWGAESSETKSAATAGGQPADLEAEVASWLRRFKSATDEEVTYVLGELAKKNPGEVPKPKAYADRALQTYRTGRLRAAEYADRYRRSVQEDEDPNCRHRLKLSQCEECTAEAKKNLSRLMPALAALAEMKGA